MHWNCLYIVVVVVSKINAKQLISYIKILFVPNATVIIVLNHVSSRIGSQICFGITKI